IAPLCDGPLDKRKQVAYESLSWRAANRGSTQINKPDAERYIDLLRAIYIPKGAQLEAAAGGSGSSETTTTTTVELPEFSAMFDDRERGFGILSSLAKLETGDRIRHGRQVCAACRYPIIGSRFREAKWHFSLCSQCYSEGRVPSSAYKQEEEEYTFKEYANETAAMKDKCLWFGSKSSK
ncbi:hypothetical protein M569_16782, partial [Genlisea aurea]